MPGWLRVRSGWQIHVCAPVARTSRRLGNVGARDEKHEAHSAKQHQQRLTHVADDTVAERLNGETLLGICHRDRRGGYWLAASFHLARWPGPALRPVLSSPAAWK